MSVIRPNSTSSDQFTKTDPGCDEVVVFFSIEAIDRAFTEGRIPADYAEEMKGIINRPGEVAVVLEWRGLAQAKRRDQADILGQEVTLKKLLGSRWSH